MRRQPGGLDYLAEVHPSQRMPQESRRGFLCRQQTLPSDLLVELVRDPSRSPELRATALRFVNQGGRQVELEFLHSLTNSHAFVLQLEAVRTLQQRASPEGDAVLRSIADDPSKPRLLRAEAIVGLAYRASDDGGTRRLLIRLAKSPDPVVRRESLRSLRGLAVHHPEVKQGLLDLATNLASRSGESASSTDRDLAEHLMLAFGAASADDLPTVVGELERPGRPLPNDVGGWSKIVDSGGDVQSGRRVFFHPNGPGCSRCHSVRGRGDWRGPALSQVGRCMSRRALIESVVAPGREIAGPFLSTVVATTQGKTYTGMIVAESETRLTLLSADGETVTLLNRDIAQRTSERTSVMPDKLTDRMTVQEFRDLVAFLSSLQ